MTTHKLLSSYHLANMSKPSPPPSPSWRLRATDNDTSLDSSHAMAMTAHKDNKPSYEVPLCQPINRYHEQTPKIIPPPLPAPPDLVTKKPAKDQVVGVSDTQPNSTYASSLPKHPSFDYEEQKQSPSSSSTPSTNLSASSSSYETNNEVVPNVSAYFLYQNANRDYFKSLYPKMSKGELSKYTSQRYKSLEPHEKAAWTAQASQLNAARLSVEQGNSGNHLSKKTPSKKRKDPDAPKRAVGAYVWFTMEERPKIQNEFKGIKFAEMGKLLGERWRGLTPDERKKYDMMASKDRVRLQTELKAYKEKQMLQQKARKTQVDGRIQQQDNLSKSQNDPQPVADIYGYNPQYEYSDEFCSDIIQRLSED